MGLIQTLMQNGSLFLHPGHGFLGLLAIPYFWLVEAISPLVELIAYIVVPLAMYQGWISVQMACMYLGIGIAFNLLITMMGVYFDNKYVSKNKTWSMSRSMLETILIHFGYKQMNSWWRLFALMKGFTKASWGEKPREEIIHRI